MVPRWQSVTYLVGLNFLPVFPSYPIVNFHVYLLLGETTVKKLSDCQIPSYSLIVSTWGALTSRHTGVCFGEIHT